MERKAIGAQIHQSQSGQIIGGIIVFSCLGISAWMGYLGNTVVATAVGTTTVIGLATIYYLGKRVVQSSLDSKSHKQPKKKNK